MDTSETYIKMCQRATEIQSLRDTPASSWDQKMWETGDMAESRGNTFLWCEGCEQEFGPFQMQDYIWLPRQDQLQEMLDISLDRLIPELKDYQEWEMDILQSWGSLEQLWLHFVMQEKYGKAWDGEDWIPTRK